MTLNIKSIKVPRVQGKRFRDSGKLHRYVRIYLESDNSNELNGIDSVQYELHPTFRERIRVSDDFRNQFEIKIWTWGYFKIRAKLLMKDGNVKSIDGYVEW